MKKLFVAVLLLVLAPQAALAQVELVVRLDETAGAPLAQALRQQAQRPAVQLSAQAQANAQVAPLFQGVQQARAVFGPAAAAPAAPSALHAYTLRVADSSALAAVRAQWEGAPGVRYVQENHVYTLDQPDDPAASPGADIPAEPLQDRQRYFPLIRAAEAWQVTTGAPDVRIGVIDSGLFFEHPDFAGQVWVNPGEDLNGNGQVDEADFNGLDDDGNGFADDLRGYDFVDRPSAFEKGDFAGRDPDPSHDADPPAALRRTNDHGTAVAGILGAALDGAGIAGVAPGARLVPLRAFAADGGGTDADIAAAIVYAADLGLEVLNFSFGDVFYSPLMKEAIQYAAAQGCVMVASAGNDGFQQMHYPSDYEDVLSVVWLNQDGSAKAPEASFNAQVDLGAPGTAIFTTVQPPPESDAPNRAPNEERLYDRATGSSFAAPMVAGAAALLRALDPSLAPSSVRSALNAAATDLGADGRDPQTGAGRLDVAAALARALPARTELTAPALDAGLEAARVPIVGSAVDPGFLSYQVDYAPGYEDLRASDWQPITKPTEQQAYRDTLGVWDVSALPEGVYTLRLVTALRGGQTVQVRRRVYVDRTAPQLDVRLVARGLVGGAYGVLTDVKTDDLTRLTLQVRLRGQTHVVESEGRAFRHGLVWADADGAGGRAQVTLTATSPAGYVSTYETEVELPRNTSNAALFDEERLDMPAGRLLRTATDYDGDGLLELSFNQTGGDTLATYEWAGSGFRPAQRLTPADFPGLNLDVSPYPRDAGDTNGNGLGELLTQLNGVTLLLEQPESGAFPRRVIFSDTTGKNKAGREAGEALNGVRLADLDRDGRGEIVAHNGRDSLRADSASQQAATARFRVLEYDGSAYSSVADLTNRTDPAPGELDRGNAFGGAEAATGDFDGDGRRDLLVGDVDGDWIVYEVTGDDAYKEAWTYETSRYDAGARFAAGDFDGDGADEFVTYTENWRPLKRPQGGEPISALEREPPYSFYTFWDSSGDDTYDVVRRLPVLGVFTEGALRAADFDGDGRAEVALVHPPNLYVFDFGASRGWRLAYHRGVARPQVPDGMLSRVIATGDFDLDGRPEIVAAAADEAFHRFSYQAAAAERPPPRWAAAAPLEEGRVRLKWRAPGADSVTVFRGAPAGPLDRVASLAGSSYVDAPPPDAGPQQYRLRAWYRGQGSALSEARRVRPHAAAHLVATTYPDPSYADGARVRLRFSAALDPALRAKQFRLGGGPSDGGLQPDGLIFAENRTAVQLRFASVGGGQSGTLRWRGVRDAEGVPVADTAAAVAFPEGEGGDGQLLVASWEFVDTRTVALTFSAPLDPAMAADVTNYRYEPEGAVAAARLDPQDPARVVLELRGGPIGAVGPGRDPRLRVLRMRSAAGARLAEEGHVVRLVHPAESLAGVFVYPNPFRAGQHDRLTVAGLPREATVQVLSVQGTLVKVLEETGGDGGTLWDLTDRQNQTVPAGVYLIRVEAPGERPVLKKAAVIR